MFINQLSTSGNGTSSALETKYFEIHPLCSISYTLEREKSIIHVDVHKLHVFVEDFFLSHCVCVFLF